MAEFNTITELPLGITPPRPKRVRRLTSAHKPSGPVGLLTRHFFRRFFDNDTVQTDGDTVTTVARAIAATSVPGLIIGFFLQNHYGGGRTPWGAVEDQYLFLLFSFLTLGAVALFEWDMLFPDRLDFLVLSPLPLRPRALFLGKITALAAFLSLFLVSANLFGALLLPAITHGQFFRQLGAHVVATAAAGIFAALFFLALGGILLCVLGGNLFRTISPLVQLVSVTALALVLVHYGKAGDNLHLTLAGTCTSQPAAAAPELDPPPAQTAYFVQHYKVMQPAPSCPSPALGKLAWLPPVWFLGLYQHLLYGGRAPAFAAPMAARALESLGLVTLIVFATYPVAWARMRRLALEGTSRPRSPAPAWRNALLHRIISRPGERALFHFIGQTLARNNRYQVYFALYSGTGLAMALACAVVLSPGGAFSLSRRGLHAILPLLLFWVIAGLRTAFAFPLSLAAGWIFRITGVSKRDCAAAGRRWTFFSALSVLVTVLAVLAAAGWTPRTLLVQAATGLALALLLSDAFFFFNRAVPFNQVRLPGRTNLPLVLTLYIGVFPPFIFAVIYLEAWLESNPWRLLGLAAVVTGLHLLDRMRDHRPEEIEEEMEGYEYEFQILGLS